MDTNEGLAKLKDILFEEEKEKYYELNKKLREVHSYVDASLSNRTVPDHEIDQIVGEMVQIMPEKLGPTITNTLKTQIKESRDDVVQALFPIVGQMIKRYVSQEIAVLSERIDKQLDAVFSLENLALRVKAFFSGVRYSELMLQQAKEPLVNQIFIIEEHSGMLMASYTREKSLDDDMVAGMLTAIKSFVKDSFDQGNQELEMVSYDSFSIYIQSFSKFYVAVALSGVVNAAFKKKLDDRILKFMKDISVKYSDLDEKKLTQKIEQHFQKI